MRSRVVLAALSVLSLTGCVSSILAHKIVAPPNKSGIKPLFSDLGILEHAPEAFAETWIVPIRQPRADIAVASIEPGDYALEYDLRLAYADGKAPTISHFSASWRAAAEVARYPDSKGTVILLHGFLQNRNSMTPWAIRLAQAGYRCAVLDLRGQGASTGKHISFGAFLLKQVIHELKRDELVRVHRHRIPATRVLDEVGAHPVVEGVRDVVDRLAVLAAMELGAALARRTDIGHGKALVEYRAEERGLAPA